MHKIRLVKEGMALRMGCFKASILAAVFIISLGCTTAPGTQYGPVAYDKGNLDRLLNKNSCPGCNLSGADLSGTNLEYADLSGANLSGANLSSAMLVEANLTNADLSGADLNGATLRGADLSGAVLNGAGVVGAYFLGTKGLSPAQVEDLKSRGALFRGASL